jgi:pimeloyl-ACP methyl ester carboxylesterase
LSADTLAGLIRHVDRGPALAFGGSAGARVSLIVASRFPGVVSRLCLLWISGGAISLAALGAYYSGGSAIAAAKGGMQAVAALPEWRQQLALNPRNRDLLLAQDPDVFIETMQRWCAAFFPTADSPVPGMTPADFAGLRLPVLVFRSGKPDLHHTRRTSEEVHRLIRGSRIVEPPWGESEWYERLEAQGRGESIFAHWPALAPQIVEFARA